MSLVTEQTGPGLRLYGSNEIRRDMHEVGGDPSASPIDV